MIYYMGNGPYKDKADVCKWLDVYRWFFWDRPTGYRLALSEEEITESTEVIVITNSDEEYFDERMRDFGRDKWPRFRIKLLVSRLRNQVGLFSDYDVIMGRKRLFDFMKGERWPGGDSIIEDAGCCWMADYLWREDQENGESLVLTKNDDKYELIEVTEVANA